MPGDEEEKKGEEEKDLIRAYYARIIRAEYFKHFKPPVNTPD